MSTAPAATATLGAYLRDRRRRLDPGTLGYSMARRRTPGLRREEVAARAHISPTWYTWLEQGRGGAPSAPVLDRIAKALMLTGVEREHVYLLALGRAPDVRYLPVEGVSPRLQRVIDALEVSPAIVRTATWDVVAWNRAASVVLTDYAALSVRERNVLRMMFLNPHVRSAQAEWESVARFVVGVFRADIARAGVADDMQSLVEELTRASPEFAALWRDHDVREHGEGVKRLRHPRCGDLALEYSSFAVDGRPDLTLLVYNPVGEGDAQRIRTLMGEAP